MLLFQEECNTYACEFDGKECSYHMMMYQNCSAIRQGIPCYNMFKNGICDKACSSEECLFDGYDCQPALKECNPIYETYCKNHYANLHCDKGCNTAECDWDGLDCETEHSEVLADGSLVIIVLVRPEQFREQSVGFLRQVGHLLRAIVRVKLDTDGNEMIYPWPEVKDTYSDRVKRAVFGGGRDKRAAGGKSG